MRANTIRLLILLFLLAGCQILPGTNDKSTDASAAQNFVPASVAGYNTLTTTSITDALTKAGVASSTLTGNIPLAAAIAKVDDVVRCLQGVGAVASNVYIAQALDPAAPKAGVVAVINTTRVGRNIIQCAVNTGMSAQSASAIEPCGGSGSFKSSNEDLVYLYAATTPELCSTFQTYFNGLPK